MSGVDRATLVAFVAREARLLDERRHDEWLALFAPEGRYWVPLKGAAQGDDERHNSIADEDLLLLKLRIERLKRADAYGEQPPSRCQHVLQSSEVTVSDEAAGRYELVTPFLYAESRGERRTLLPGMARHRLIARNGTLAILEKRVDLLDAGDPLPPIHLFP